MPVSVVHSSAPLLALEKRSFFHPLLLIFLIPVTQLPGLAFTGMEHSLQLFLTSLFFFGLVRYGETQSPSWWFCAAIILGPEVEAPAP